MLGQKFGFQWVILLLLFMPCFYTCQDLYGCWWLQADTFGFIVPAGIGGTGVNITSPDNAAQTTSPGVSMIAVPPITLRGERGALCMIELASRLHSLPFPQTSHSRS